MRLICAFLFCCVAAGATAAFPKPNEAPPAPKGAAINERVAKLFASMRDGSYDDKNGLEFPKLGWDDVPSLMELAGSETTLRTFPTNPLTSHLQTECVEGVAAMWLIEGIRQGGKHPSNNPMVMPDRPVKGNYEKISQACHADAVKAYRAW